ncbi:MAG: hypothetical protein M3N19_06975, partial [Candidatus Eremiobacteraeota bacterium]|nr:hypothetical protein [Candidatus Eremiobacteraeota bacterium]
SSKKKTLHPTFPRRGQSNRRSLIERTANNLVYGHISSSTKQYFHDSLGWKDRMIGCLVA